MSFLLNVGTLVDSTGAAPSHDMSVRLDGNRIVEIGPQGSLSVGDDQAIDAPSCTLLPGLIDLHFHMTLTFSGRTTGPDDPSLRRDELIAARIFHAANAGKMWLQLGVTTIRDAGGPDNLAVGMKEAIDDGLTAGPRVIPSGSLIAQTGGVRAGNERFVVEVTGADEARRVARQQLKAGVEVLKIYAASSIGGGGARLVGEPGWPQLTLEEISAVVEEAHKPGRLASAHTMTAESIKNCIRAGVDWLDHADFTDDEAIAMLLDTDTPIVPTMTAAWSMANFGRFGPYIAQKSREVGAKHKECLRRAYQAGVRIATGTDAGNPSSSVAKECELLTEVGMSPLEAISAATRTPAQILRLDHKIGTIEPGKIADLLLVRGNPAENIRCLTQVEAVVQSGKMLELPLVDLARYGY